MSLLRHEALQVREGGGDLETPESETETEAKIKELEVKELVQREAGAIRDEIIPLVQWAKRQRELEDEKAAARQAGKTVAVEEGYDVTKYDRSQRESLTRNFKKANVRMIQLQRTVDSLQHALSAVLSQHQDYADDVDTGIVDLASVLENIFTHANKIGRKPFADRFKPLLAPIILGVGGIFVALAVLQPGTLTIIGGGLNNQRNLVIFLGVVGLAFGYLFYDRHSKNRSAKKARTQLS